MFQLTPDTPAWVTAWATIVLAGVGVIGIVANVALAVASFRAANAARRATKAQERQLALLERQLTLLEEQTRTAAESARPKLMAGLTGVGQLYHEGNVIYAHGTDPAEDVEVWVRGPSRKGAAWGLYHAHVGFVVPSAGSVAFRASAASDQEQDRLPFAEFMEGEPAPGELWLGVAWRRPNGIVDRWAAKTYQDGRPPETFPLSRPVS